MGESASARTDRELAALRGDIARDVDALRERLREDVDPRNLVARQPLAVLGTVASLVTAVAVKVARGVRERRAMEAEVDVLVERFGGRIDKLKGKARQTFRKQLRTEMAEVGATGPKAVAWGVIAATLTALATTTAQMLGRRGLGAEPADREG